MKVSIIVPIYNVEKSLYRCVDSILKQTLKDIEIILVDDGSSDKCPEICDKYQLIDERVKVIHKNNGGVSSARNAGLQIATGDYVGFVDSDDWIEEDMYEILLYLANKYEAQMVSCKFIDEVENEINNNERIVETEEECIYSGEKLYSAILNSKLMGGYACNKIFRRNMIEYYFDEELSQCEDHLFSVKYLSNVRCAVYTNRGLYHYQHRISRDCFSYDALKVNIMDAYEQLLNVYAECAPSLVDKVRLNALKIYLNYRARYRIMRDENVCFKEKIEEGIKRHFFSVLSSKVPLKSKINIILTFIAPKLVLKTKRKIIKRMNQNGYWEN